MRWLAREAFIVDQDQAKTLVGQRAAELVEDGQLLGLGTGSTVAKLLDALATRIEDEGIEVVGVPTSQDTQARCEKLGIPTTTLEAQPRLDLCLDGADEVAPGLQLIKGGGGALFREKVVASASDRFVVIVDTSKEVQALGTGFDLPIEVVPYARPVVEGRLADLSPTVRESGGHPFTTDNGNHILDLATGPIEDPHHLADRLAEEVGVLEHGLFLDMADTCLVAGPGGVQTRTT